MISGTCSDCGNDYPYLQRAHIIAKHKGGTDDPSNIVMICPNCHFIRDRAERVEWLQKRWEKISPEQRSQDAKARMDALTPEQQVARGRKISASKTGKTYESSARSQRRRLHPETPEQKIARGRKISASKLGTKYKDTSKMGGARPITQESIIKRSEKIRQKWAAKTPEELEAWRQRCREVKKAKRGLVTSTPPPLVVETNS